MKSFVIALAILAAGCTSTGTIAPDAGVRAANFVACNAALASLGLSISADSKNPQADLDKVTGVISNPSVAQACAAVAAGLAQDAAAAQAKIDAAKNAQPAKQ